MLIKPFSDNRLLQKITTLPENLSVTPGKLTHRLKKDVGYIQDMAITPDGSLLAVVSDSLVVLYDLNNDTEILRHRAVSGKALSVALHNSGKLLAMGTSRGEVIIYDIADKKVKQTHRLGFYVKCIRISEPLDLIAGATLNEVAIHSLKTGKWVYTLPYNSKINDLSFVSAGFHLWVQTDMFAEIRDIRTGENIATFYSQTPEGQGELMTLPKYLALNVIGCDVVLWDVLTKTPLRRFTHPKNVWRAEIDTMTQRVITVCEDNKIRIFNFNSTHEDARISDHPNTGVYISFAQSDQWIISGHDRVRIFDKKTNTKIKEIKGYTSSVITVCLTRDEQHLLVGGLHGSLKMYDLETGRQIRRFEGHSSWISAVAIDEDQNIVATASHDRTAKIFTLSGQLIHTLSGHKDNVHTVAISPTDDIIATGGRDHKIILWDKKKGKPIRSWYAHNGYVRSLVFDSKGEYLLSAGEDGLARLWSLEWKYPIMEYGFHSHTVYSAVFSPDGKTVATASQDRTFHLHTLQGDLKMVFSGHVNGIREVFFNKDKTVVSVSLDGTAKRWDPSTGRCIQTYSSGHRDWLRCVWVRSDGVLILGSKDGTVSFSDLESGETLATLHNLDSKNFLWTTPPDNTAPSGWFWTDRQDLIEIVETDQNGKSKLLDPDSDPCKDYKSTYNSMTQVMSRLTNKSADKKQFEHMLRLHSTIQKNQTISKLLESP